MIAEDINGLAVAKHGGLWYSGKADMIIEIDYEQYNHKKVHRIGECHHAMRATKFYRQTL